MVLTPSRMGRSRSGFCTHCSAPLSPTVYAERYSAKDDMGLLAVLAQSALKVAPVVATAGSLLVHHDERTGKDSLNLVPAVVWFYGLSVVGCSFSHGELFSQCVQSVFNIFK